MLKVDIEQVVEKQSASGVLLLADFYLGLAVHLKYIFIQNQMRNSKGKPD